MDQAQETESTPELPARPVIKRRWAIMRRAGGGVAVIAVASAIGLGNASDQADYGDDPGGSSPQISAES